LFAAGQNGTVRGKIGKELAGTVGNILAVSSTFVSASYVASNCGKKNLSKNLEKFGKENGPAAAVGVVLLNQYLLKIRGAKINSAVLVAIFGYQGTQWVINWYRNK